MALCPAEGRPDMYGLGIRLAFYIDWFSVALIEYIHEQDLADVRLLGFLLSLAVTISIIVQIVNNDLDPIDINIALILTMGIYVLLTPLYLWRFMTCFNQYLDPLRFSKEEPPPPVFRLMRFLLLIVNAGIGTWFFTTYLAESNLGCDQYAFFLSRMNIDSTVYIAFGAMFFIIVILACICVLFVKSGWITGFEGQERPGRAMRRIHGIVLTEYRLLGTLTVIALLILAIELPISWNKLDSVNHLDTAAQLLPFLLVVGFMVRTFSIHYFHCRFQDDSSSSSSSGGPDPGFTYGDYPWAGRMRWAHWPATPPDAHTK